MTNGERVRVTLTVGRAKGEVLIFKSSERIVRWLRSDFSVAKEGNADLISVNDFLRIVKDCGEENKVVVTTFHVGVLNRLRSVYEVSEICSEKDLLLVMGIEGVN